MASLTGAIDQLRRLIGRAPHDYIPSAQFFLELDVQKIAEDLDLRRKGTERGEANLPSSDSETLDAVEQEIVGYCQAEYERNHHQYTDALQTFRQRLANLNLGGFLVDISLFRKEALPAFEAEVHQGLDELYRRRRGVLERERDLREFQAREGLRRAPHYPESHLLHIGIIAILLLGEGVLNGSMLAVGHEMGLLGGFLQAVAIALINVAVGFLVGRYLVRELFHKDLQRKLLGLIVICAFLAFSFVFNLGVAHFRDALQMLEPDADREALRRLLAEPLYVKSLASWLLMLLGMVFSLIAAADGLQWDDRYPGYGRLAKLRDQAYEDYVEGKEEQLGDLEQKREAAVSAMRRAKRNAENRQAEFQAIIAHRQNLISHFARRPDSLERAANQLLTTYREPNQAARSTPLPAHFRQRWVLPKIDPKPEGIDDPQAKEDVQTTVGEVGQVLEECITKVQDAYVRAMRRYRQIEDLTERELVEHHGQEEKP